MPMRAADVRRLDVSDLRDPSCSAILDPTSRLRDRDRGIVFGKEVGIHPDRGITLACFVFFHADFFQ
jgi:hypothetical protein